MSDFEVPESLESWFREVHGPEGWAAFSLPEDYVAFLRENPEGIPNEDPYGWCVFSWDGAMARTEGGYELFLESDIETDVELSRACLLEAGIWLQVGDRGRHDHFLCCDRRMAEFGQVYDLNDGHPATGNVYDLRWPSFAAYVAR